MSAEVLDDDHDSCPIGDDLCSVGEPVDVSITGTIMFDPHEANVTCIAYFYGIGCSKCAEIKPFMEEMEDKYCDRIKIHFIEVYNITWICLFTVLW